MAVPALTEDELREAIDTLDKFKSSGLRSSRFDPELSTGKTISFVKSDDNQGWVLK